MASFKAVSLAVLAVMPAALASATLPTTFRISEGSVITMKLVNVNDFPDRLSVSERLITPLPHVNKTVLEPTARLNKRDGSSCYIPSIPPDTEDCNAICQFFNDYPLTIAQLPAYNDVYWNLGTCTFGVTNRTPCSKTKQYGIFASFCDDMLSNCIIERYDGYYNLTSYGLSMALFGEAAAPAYSPMAC